MRVRLSPLAIGNITLKYYDMELKNVKIEFLEQNTGQIAGLPKNPRQWTGAELNNLVKSILETPELLEARGLIVTKPIGGGNYVVLGGNMRLEACRRIGYKEMPCFVLPDDTTAEKMKEIVIKDNGAFGGWDWEAIAEDWNVDELKEWFFDTSFLMETDGGSYDLELKDVGNRTAPGSNEFQMTFIFPNTVRGILEAYVKANGKAPIVDCIIALAKSKVD